MIIFAIVAWRLAAEAIGSNVAPDHIAFLEAANAVVPASRMAASTSVGFLLAAISLVLVQSPNRNYRAVAQYFAFALGLIALFAAVAYLYGSGVRDSKLFSLMAAHTSWGLLLLALGLLFKNTDVGWMSMVVSRRAAGKLLRLMLPAAILVPRARADLRFG